MKLLTIWAVILWDSFFNHTSRYFNWVQFLPTLPTSGNVHKVLKSRILCVVHNLVQNYYLQCFFVKIAIDKDTVGAKSLHSSGINVPCFVLKAFTFVWITKGKSILEWVKNSEVNVLEWTSQCPYINITSAKIYLPHLQIVQVHALCAWCLFHQHHGPYRLFIHHRNFVSAQTCACWLRMCETEHTPIQ